MRKLLIGLVVLIVLLVAADRISVLVAENEISGRIQSSYGLPEKPSVSITGIPFLTQVITGHYSDINVSVGQVEAGGTMLHDLQARFTDVHAPISQVLGQGADTVTANRASGSAVVSFAEVDKRLPAGLKLRPDGHRLLVSGTVKYQGSRVPVSAVVQLSVSGAGIRVKPVHVTIPGGTGLPASAAYAARLGVVVPVTALPLHLHLVSVQFAPGGLRIEAAARHVHFARA